MVTSNLNDFQANVLAANANHTDKMGIQETENEMYRSPGFDRSDSIIGTILGDNFTSV